MKDIDLASKILVADDEERNLHLMEALLAPLECDIVFATDGEETIQKIYQDKPDLVLLDIMMPKLDGYEVAKRLKSDEKTMGIPIVMVTALRDVEDRVKALEAGADDFLSKPVDKIELLARVRSLLKIKNYYDNLYKSQKQLEEEVLVKSNQMKKAYEEAKQASLETVIRLSKAAEYKDEETGAHIRRISHYAAALARKIGLSEEMVEIILYAAPMHDIGKIGIPEKILLKQGSLDPDEWDIMKQHTTIGAQILHGSKADFIRFAEIIAFTHHEKWDGTGYPQGLKGTDIPLIGRIVAIVDVFDALTTKRPYRDALSVEDSLNFIIERRGTHFDPNLVDAFLEIKDDILSIKLQYKENQESLLIQLTEKKYKSPLITNKAMSMTK